MSYLNEYPEEQDQDIQVIQRTVRYLSENEVKDQEKSDALINKLVEIQPKYGGKNTGELFNTLIESVKLK